MPISKKTDKINIPWVMLTIVMLITLHLRVFKVSTFEVALGLLLLPFWLIKTFNVFPIRINLIGVIIFFISILIPFGGYEYTSDFKEFLNSYLLFFVSIILIIFLWYKKKVIINTQSINIAIIAFQIILANLCVVQYISFTFFNNEAFYNIWGNAHLYYALPAFERMKGFYLEPSYLGFVTLSVFWLKLTIDKNPRIYNFCVTFIILFCAKSGFAFYGIVLLLLHWYFINMKFYMKVLYICAFLVLSPSIFVLLNSDSFKEQTRLEEISDEKYTSGYVRNILPIVLIEEMWKENRFLGIQFGQAEWALEQVIPFKVRETEINNSFYAIIIYFGVFGVALYLFLIIKYFTSNNILQKSYIVLFFILLQNSGALLAPQTLMIAIFLPSITLKKNLLYAE